MDVNASLTLEEERMKAVEGLKAKAFIRGVLERFVIEIIITLTSLISTDHVPPRRVLLLACPFVTARCV